MEQLLWVVGKAAAYTTLVLTLLVVLFRGAVVTLWGSHSDLGLIAAPLVGVIGLVIILYIAGKLVQDVVKTANKSTQIESKGE